MRLVEKLVRIPSVSGSESKAVNLFIDEMSILGFETEIDKVGNAIGTFGNGPIIIYLIGHIDTVEGDIPVKVEKNLLFGRGSVDAKGCLSAFAESVGRSKDLSNEITFKVIGCVAEETDSKGCLHVINSFKEPNYIIIGEPSGWSGITLGYKGCFNIFYENRVPISHSGASEKTSAELAFNFFNYLNHYTKDNGVEFNKLSFRLLKINTFFDGTHSTVKMQVNVRTPSGFNFKEFSKLLNQKFDSSIFKITDLISPIITSKRNRLVSSFLNSIRNSDGKPSFKYKTGTSDMNLVGCWNCPILAYGPGDSSLDHTPNEHLSLDEYDKSINVLTKVFTKLI